MVLSSNSINDGDDGVIRLLKFETFYYFLTNDFIGIQLLEIHIM